MLRAGLLSLLLLPVASVARQGGGLDVHGQAPGVANELPAPLQGISIEQKIGAQVDRNLTFADSTGKTVTLGDYLDRGKPVLLSLVYYSCPSLCNLHLNGVTDLLRDLKWTPGEEFTALAVSFDPKETSAISGPKRENHLAALGKVGAENGWHFLTGSEDAIRSLTSSVGFGFKWDEPAKQWAHGSALIVLTAAGQVSRYIHGVAFEPQTVRLALTEAGRGKVGSVVDTIMLYCFQFDPTQNRYVFYAFNIMRLGAALVALVLLAFLGRFWMTHGRHAGRVA